MVSGVKVVAVGKKIVPEIVPNITTSGYRFTRDKAKTVKQYCGTINLWNDETNPITVDISLNHVKDSGIFTIVHFRYSSFGIILSFRPLILSTFQNKSWLAASKTRTGNA